MAEYIECRRCDSPYCDGCNLNILSKMLHNGKCDRIMDDSHTVNPAADVVEVRHGEWLHTQEPLGWRDVDCIECSACKESWIMDEDLCLDDYNTHWRYCLNCGAKMDGKGEK